MFRSGKSHLWWICVILRISRDKRDIKHRVCKRPPFKSQPTFIYCLFSSQHFILQMLVVAGTQQFEAVVLLIVKIWYFVNFLYIFHNFRLRVKNAEDNWNFMCFMDILCRLFGEFSAAERNGWIISNYSSYLKYFCVGHWKYGRKIKRFKFSGQAVEWRVNWIIVI